jgi:hypothetical protein
VVVDPERDRRDSLGVAISFADLEQLDVTHVTP